MTPEYVDALIQEGGRATSSLGSLKLNDPMYVRDLVKRLTDALRAVKRYADMGAPGQ